MRNQTLADLIPMRSIVWDMRTEFFPRRFGRRAQTGASMTYRISYRRHLTGAMTVAALIVNVPAATAQPAQQQAKIASGIDEAVKAIGNLPRLKKMSPQAKRQLVEFVMGNTLFVMAHEIGHGLINEMNMPVLGREEDAADSFAVVNALKMASVFSERVLIEAAKGWVLAGKRDKKQGKPLAFYDEHGLDLQRAYNVVCFMVGSDPEKYKALAADTKLPEYRQISCVVDWKNTSWSWDEKLKPHLRSADKPKVTIKVEYQDEEEIPNPGPGAAPPGLARSLCRECGGSLRMAKSILDRGALMRRSECPME